MELLYIVFIWLSSHVFGQFFLKLFKIKIDKSLVNLVSFSLGWAILSFYILLLVGLHILFKEIILLSLVILTSVGIYFLKDQFTLSKPNFYFRNNKLNILFIAIIAWLSFFNLFDVLAPPTVADSLTYHFKIPLRYIEENGFFYNPFFHYNAPHLLEVFSIVGFIFESESLVHLQYYSFNFLVLWIFLTLSKRYLGNFSVGIFAFAIYFVTPMATDLKSAGYVEIGLSVVTILSIWMLFEALKENAINKNYFILSASFLGMALSIKYYGLFTAFIVFFLVLFYLYKNKIGLKNSLKHIAIYTFFTLLFGSFFYVINYINTGNPIYPAMYGIFGGADYSVELNELMKEMTNIRKKPAGDDMWGFVISLWHMTMDGDKFLAGRNGYGPIFLLIPILFLPFSKSISKDTKRLILFFIVFIVATWILWYLLAIQRTRHLLPIILLLTFVISLYIYDLKQNMFYKSKLLKYTLGGFFVVFFLFGLLINLIFTMQFIQIALNKVNKESYLDKKLPNYKGIVWTNENLPKGSKVFHYLGNREYYIKHNSYYASPYFQGRYDFTKIKSADAFYKKLKNDGFTHIISKTSFL